MDQMEKELPYSVECNQGRYWERIAAFNVISVARQYKDECQETNPQFAYRVAAHYDCR